MKKILFLLAAVGAFAIGAMLPTVDVKAQCNGVFPNNTLCGNISGAPAPPAAFATTSLPVASVSVNWINVKNNPCNAAGNGTTDDTAAINTCIANFNTATNGVLYFPAGTYKTTTGLTAVTANGMIVGDGPSNFTGQVSAVVMPATQLNTTHTSSPVFTINSQNLVLKDLSINNIASTTPIAGSAGIVVTSATEYSNKVDMEDVQVQSFYIGIDRQAGANWVMHNILVTNPVLYGVKIRNINNADFGDWTISDSNFNTGATYGGTDAIRIESSGGGKISNFKINCQQTAGNCNHNFTNGVDVQGSGLTSDLQITNGSIENYSGVGIIINGSWPKININNIQLFSPLAGQCMTITNNAQIAIDNILTSGNSPCIVMSGSNQDMSITNITGNLDGITPVSGTIPAPLGAAVGILTKANNVVFGESKQVLLQGQLTTENRSTSFSSLMNINLGTSFIAGGTPNASVFFGLIGPNNDLFAGSAQGDFAYSINGGNSWWVTFNNDPNEGGTQTQGLKLSPLSAGGPALLSILGGTSGSTPIGWVNYGGQQRVSADAFVRTSSFTNVTGLAVSLTTGRTYSFDVYLTSQDTPNGGVQASLVGSNGLTASNIIYDGWTMDSNVIKGQTNATSLGVAVGGTTTTSSAGIVTLIRGLLTVGVGGTLNVQAAQKVLSATTPTTVKQGSYMIVNDMP